MNHAIHVKLQYNQVNMIYGNIIQIKFSSSDISKWTAVKIKRNWFSIKPATSSRKNYFFLVQVEFLKGSLKKWLKHVLVIVAEYYMTKLGNFLYAKKPYFILSTNKSNKKLELLLLLLSSWRVVKYSFSVLRFCLQSNKTEYLKRRESIF